MSGRNDDDRGLDASGRDRDELSNGARALIAAAREGDGPSGADRERVRRALAVAIAASAGTASAAGSAAASAKAIAAGSASGATAGGTGVAATTGAASGALASAGAAGVLTKVAIAVVAIGVGSGALVAVNHYASPTPPVEMRLASAPTHAASIEPEPTPVRGTSRATTAAPQAAVESAPVLDVTSAAVLDVTAPTTAPAVATTPRTDVGAHRRTTRSAPSAPSDENTLDEETHALRDAIAQTMTPEQRLLSVDAHATRFPSGQMTPTREGARRRAIRDLCAAGPDRVEAFLAAHPSSSSTARIRQECPTESH